MKIATITCHDVYNFGASLQAYALQEFCKSLGCEYEIINYKPHYLSGHYNLWKISNSRFNKIFIRQLYLLVKLPGRIIQLKRKRRFDSFTKSYLQISSKTFRTFEELQNYSPKANLYIAGSDQIWNTLFKNGADPAFYLSFINNSRKISYAASFATNKIFNNLEIFVKNQLAGLDAISVRETSGLNLLQSLNIKSGVQVVDPVFLLEKEIWNKLSINPSRFNSKNYILIYDCEKDENIKKISIELKARTGLPIYSISPIKRRYVNKNFNLSGPLEFLDMIRNADFVISNSFHATAFSIIFQKEFFIVNRTEAINTRMHDFLNSIGLSERIIGHVNELSFDKINFKNVENILKVQIERSKLFLQNNINLLNK